MWQKWEFQRFPRVPAQYIKHKLNLLLPSARSEARSGSLHTGPPPRTGLLSRKTLAVNSKDRAAVFIWELMEAITDRFLRIYAEHAKSLHHLLKRCLAMPRGATPAAHSNGQG